jgi:hypothetical protein
LQRWALLGGVAVNSARQRTLCAAHIRIPLIVTSDSGNVTADSGDRDRAWCCAI